MPKKRGERVVEREVRFRKAAGPMRLPALAVGVDVTWWGGSGKASDAGSRKECIAYAFKTEDGWEPPEFRRVELTGFNAGAAETESNADPEGVDLIGELRHVFDDCIALENIVVALDAPLMAQQRDLPARRKSQKVGEVERRACDRAWAASVSSSPTGWRSINIQPGSPMPPRITALVKKLATAGFGLYLKPELSPSKHLLVECFPSEILWSAGVLGHCGCNTFASMVAYKQMGKCKTVLPLDLLETVCAHVLRPCLEVAGLNAKGWFSAFWKWLSVDKFVVSGSEGRTGKCFDDAIDSMLSLIAAASLVDGRAHIHQGDDPEDGHIIGPGLPT